LTLVVSRRVVVVVVRVRQGHKTTQRPTVATTIKPYS
jgi:ribosomal protein L15E